ncbi:hypothetical protein [Rufibacter tibetensis]|uniref:hypothetical protein n=1 Tax=Rufibacter tibetensis TaxID=512763 RepID=UPI00078441D0|nr:hypothetical protein [Rufibacter tibetensis]
MHFISTTLLLILLVVAIVLGCFTWLWFLPVIGVGRGMSPLRRINRQGFKICYTVWPQGIVVFSHLLTGKQKFKAK